MKKSIFKIFLTRNFLFVVIFLFSLKSYSQTFTFMFGGNNRSYIVHTPTGYSASTKYPLVLNIHGYTNTAASQQSNSQMNAVADTGKFIVAYPDGVGKAWNCGVFNFNTNIDDVGFLSAMIDTIKKKFSVDANRVFACGFSLGGFMSHRLGCELSNKIAAIAPVSGLMGDGIASACQTKCPVPVAHFHGTNDATINYNGASGYGSVDVIIKKWVTQDGCPTTPVVTNMPNLSTTDGTTVTKYVYAPGLNSSEVILYKITGGSHSWPGSSGGSGVCQDIKASGEIWKFFRTKSLLCGVNAVDEPSASGLHFSVSPNPSNGKFSVEGSESNVQQVVVINLLGEVIYQSFNIQNVIDISDAPNGIYFVKIKTENEVSTQKIVKQ